MFFLRSDSDRLGDSEATRCLFARGGLCSCPDESSSVSAEPREMSDRTKGRKISHQIGARPSGHDTGTHFDGLRKYLVIAGGGCQPACACGFSQSSREYTSRWNGCGKGTGYRSCLSWACARRCIDIVRALYGEINKNLTASSAGATFDQHSFAVPYMSVRLIQKRSRNNTYSSGDQTASALPLSVFQLRRPVAWICARSRDFCSSDGV